MSTYTVCDGNGNILADGVEEHEAYEIAQRIADRLGETVRLSLAGGGNGGGEEIAPGTLAVVVKKIKEAADLFGLLEALQKYGALIGLAGDQPEYRIDLTKDLPKWGEPPTKHLEAYSWDAAHVLVGSGDGPFPTKWRIVAREDWDKLA